MISMSIENAEKSTGDGLALIAGAFGGARNQNPPAHQFVSENAGLRRQLKRTEAKETTFNKHKGHEVQFKFNISLAEKVDELELYGGIDYERQAVSVYWQSRPSILTGSYPVSLRY